jgi:hypothetical protein
MRSPPVHLVDAVNEGEELLVGEPVLVPRHDPEDLGEGD